MVIEAVDSTYDGDKLQFMPLSPILQCRTGTNAGNRRIEHFLFNHRNWLPQKTNKSSRTSALNGETYTLRVALMHNTAILGYRVTTTTKKKRIHIGHGGKLT